MVKINPKQGTIIPENRAALEGQAKMLAYDLEYTHLLRVIADVLDISAAGGDAYIVLGATRDKTSLTATVFIEGLKETIYDVSLLGLSIAAKSLL